MKRFKLSKSRLAAAIVLVAILVVGILFPTSGSSAKFKTQRSLSGTVSYMLDDTLAKTLSVETGENQLIPGTEIAPGAKIAVTERKTVPAFLYIKVEGELPQGLDLHVAADWEPVDGVDGVYCYKNANLPTDFTEAPVFGSVELSKVPLTDPFEVSVTAYLIEIREGMTSPAEVFAAFDPTAHDLSTAAATETFTAVNVDCEVQNDYSVKNTGDIDALIRAKVVLDRLDSAGNIDVSGGVIPAPAPLDGWVQIGDYLYWKGVVGFDENEGPVATGSVLDPNGVAAGVRITVIAEAIQAEGGAAADAWGVEWDGSGWTAVP
ncbi:MAG: hypothetical protein IKO92_00410 [Clostridia bacterium]|nr:hypothetical protein [Clostridia bacterium]